MYLFSLPQLECKFCRIWIWLCSTYNRFRNSAWGRPLVFFLSVRSIDVYILADIRNDWQGLGSRMDRSSSRLKVTEA